MDEEFLSVCNYSSVCSPTLDLYGFMHVARSHLLSQEKAFVGAISLVVIQIQTLPTNQNLKHDFVILERNAV